MGQLAYLLRQTFLVVFLRVSSRGCEPCLCLIIKYLDEGYSDLEYLRRSTSVYPIFLFFPFC